MKARLCVKSDLVSLNKWLKRRGYAEANSEQLPSVGFIVPGVAAGFIRNCETGVGMIDSLVSNSLVSSNTRHKAWNAIIKALMQQPFKYKVIMTDDKGMQARFKLQQFTPMPNHLWLFNVGG